MLRKLIMLVCLVGGTNAIAQKPAVTKTTQNAADQKIDYKQMGAPLPPFILLPFHDTSTKKNATTEPAASGAEMSAREKRKAKKKEMEMAEARKKNMAKTVKTEKDFDNGANLFVMMFNPTCSHCTDETQKLEKDIALFQKSKILMMANPSMRPYLPDFVKNFHTDDYPNTISVGMDSTGFMNDVFLYQALPQINIYNGDRKLIKTFTGEVVIDSLKQYIQ